MNTPIYNGSAVIGVLSVSYGRGIKHNKAKDLGLEEIPRTTPEGDKIRGGGTKIQADMVEIVAQRNAEDRRIKKLFRQRFAAGPLEGTYMLPRSGAGRALLDSLDPPLREDVEASVSEFEIAVLEQAPAAVREWGERIKRQLETMPIGGKVVAQDAIDALASIAACPIISDDSRTAIMALLNDARLDRVKGVDFKRKLSAIQVDVTPDVIAPRRVRRSSFELQGA